MANASFRGTTFLTTIIPKRYASSVKAAASTNENVQRQLLRNENVQVTKLENGVVVATLENYSPITRISAIVNVGPRNETYDLQGASHVLRVGSNLATKNFSSYGLSRTLDHLGANFSVSSTREQTFYKLTCNRDKFDRLGLILAEVVSEPQMKPWEVEDLQARIQLELDIYKASPEIRIVENLHKAAFKNGLSRSLYASDDFLGNLDSNQLLEFRAKNYNSDRLSLVGVGIKHANLVRLAEKFRLPKTDSNKLESTKYLGDEVREDNTSNLVHIAIACEGVSQGSKESLASAIANHAFGTGPRMKWGDGANRVARSILPLASEPAMINSFNVNYSDTGLFGFHIISDAKDTGKLAKGVLKECAKISKNGFSNEEIAAAKYKLKASLAMSLESAGGLVNAMGLSPEKSADNVNLEHLSKEIDNVSVNDVNTLVKRFATSKACLAAIGNLSNLPRLDEINA